MKNNNPKISVIMAVYNSEKYLSDAIKSILNQTISNFELIIVDDFSSDNSIKIINEFKEVDNRIILIKNTKRLGAAGSRNKAILSARGKYIAILDSDDVAIKNRLKIQFEYLEENEDIFLCGSSFLYIDEKNTILSVYKKYYNSARIAKILPKKNIIHNPTVMFRGSGKYLYREKFIQAEDYDLWLRLLSDNKKMVVLEDVLIKYRIHNKSLTNTSLKQQSLFIKKAVLFYKQRLFNNKDNYNTETFNFLINKFSADMLIASKKIKFLFKNDDKMSVMRKEIVIFIKQYKWTFWPQAFLYYLASFLPLFFRKIIKKIIFT